MSRESRRPQKTEVLSMRLDPRVRFAIDLLARVRGQSISTVVERAVQEVADRTSISDRRSEIVKNWRDYWHVNEGIRFLKVASDEGTFPTYDEISKVAFAKIHWPFFYMNCNMTQYKEWSIEILWPKIDEFMDMWERTKATDYFAAGNAMKKAISAAGVAAPEWPPKAPEAKPAATKPASSRGSSLADELDDDIPF
jgi:hypothetical protein